MTQEDGEREPTGLFSHPVDDKPATPEPDPDQTEMRDFTRNLFSNEGA